MLFSSFRRTNKIKKYKKQYYVEENNKYYRLKNDIFTNREELNKPTWWEEEEYNNFMKNTNDKIFRKCRDIVHYSRKDLHNQIIPKLIELLVKMDIKSFMEKYYLDKLDIKKYI